MTDPLAIFELTADQHRAATETERDVLMTAGAGTGKTRTLVARYVYLLSTGKTERQIAAITFTEKAAREMRNRIRQAVSDLAAASRGDEQSRWLEIESRMDAARIGTIHSLAAEILRAHPAEAKLDPGFLVVDEGLGLTFKARAVADGLAWAAGDPEAAQLFLAFTTNQLSTVLGRLLAERLEAEVLLGAETGLKLWNMVRALIEDFLQLQPIADGIQTLHDLARNDELEADAGPALGPRVELLLELWNDLEDTLAADDLLGACGVLFRIRREGLQKVGGSKKSRARAVVHEMQDLYDDHLNLWIGGAKSKDAPPSAEADAAWTQQRPRLKVLFDQALSAYRRELDSRRALDFDDLEAGALRLLETPEIGELWRARVHAVLVDEFQDTNERQRRIIEALVGDRPGALFAVGDARQSIYRFRGADVRVFRRKRQEVERSGGLAPEIELSFRAHAPLLAALDDFVGPLMDGDETSALHRVPYTALTADRRGPGASGAGPHLELVLGTGEGAERGRSAGARALANRLVELRREEVIRDWSEVALLFRASPGFEPYELALEAAGIPFVTVAGRGFYARPEIRDVINTLRAIADPSDDLALAGFLRSPALGLSDSGLYLLRVDGSKKRPLRAALAEASRILDGEDLRAAARAQQVLEEMHLLADRLPVAELIGLLVDRLDWRAVMASSHSRLWRNLDKLVDDAQVSELVNVNAFLEYLGVLREVGAREGEAPAGEGGALQLMTIHKAKGLEFDLVVLADASRSSPQRSQSVYLMDEIGAAAAMDRVEDKPLVYRLARALDAKQSQAEEDRLLYVAATRARERLIISGHLSESRGSYKANGWMKETLELFDLDPKKLVDGAGSEMLLDLPGGERLRAWADPGSSPLEWVNKGTSTAWPDSAETPLFHVASVIQREQADSELDAEPERSWRATGSGRKAPATAVGRIVHAAIQRGAMPGNPAFERFLENEAFRAGLVDPSQRRAAIRESTELLERLAAHDLWTEITSATEIQHEIPFTTSDPDGVVQSGQIDLLWRDANGWKIVDFKTDTLRSDEDLEAAVKRHRKQVERYVRSAANILGEQPIGMLCFLDSHERVELVEV
ncbi:MAG: UvrD-helicase domain-containing protein [Chloroflexi bacterium]|nr:UvrD-helicase domain-containing protein [Chloroflexota bacterium]